MANDNKLSAKSGIDTTDFKTGIATMNRELRVLESGFRASAASLGDWANDATGLESRIKTLTSSMEIQQRKVQATREEYERIKAEKGENSRAAQELEIKLNKETETLNKMGAELQTTEGALQELESGSDEAGDSVDELGTSTEDTGGKMEGFKTVLGGVGAVIGTTVGLVLGLVAAVAAVAGVIGGLIFSTANASAQLVDMSTKTGISTTRLQELDYISGQVGTSLDTITGAQARLVRSMSGASEQVGTFNQKLDEANESSFDNLEAGDVVLGDMAKSFETLGVSVTDANGNLRDTQTVFAETIDALGKIDNAAERDALSMSIFGKSAQELNPLIKAGSAELEELAEKAHEVGAVMSEEDVAAFEAFDDTLASLQAGLKGTLGTLVSAFLPGFQAVFDQVGGYLKTFTDIVNGADGDFGKIAEGLTGLVSQIATDIAAQAPQLLSAGLSIVTSILDAIIAALPALLTAAVEILRTLIAFIVEALPTLINAGVEIVLTLVDAIIQNLPGLIEAALQAIITLANGLSAALPTLIPAVVEAILMIVNTLIANLPLLITAALTLLQALAEGLIVALPVLIAAVPQIIEALLAALIVTLPLLLEMGGKLIATLIGGIVASLPLFGASITKVGVVLLEKLAELTKQLPEIGRGFINGIIDGIETAKGLLFDTIVNMASDMILSMMSALGMSSPSRKGMAIGNNFISSMALGGQQAMSEVERAFASMAGSMATAAAGGLGSGPSNTVNNSTDNIDIWGNVIIQGETPAESLGSQIKMKRF